MKTFHTKTTIGAAAIALFVLSFVPVASFAASPPPSTMVLDMSGIVGNPSTGIVGAFTMHLDGSTTVVKGSLAQGVAYGTYNGTPVVGGFSYNTATGKALMKLVPADGSNSFALNLAFLYLPPVGFTFQGIIHINGQGPVMLSATSLNLVFS